MRQFEASVCFVPDEPLRYLPEGPYRCGDGRVSWVAIQHGAEQTRGSLNLLTLPEGLHRSYPLPGRPGFAFPTTRDGWFVIGMERAVQLFHPASGRLETVLDGVDDGVDGTIINDGLVLDQWLVFGCKDLAFQHPKAGLYLCGPGFPRGVQLASSQVCSNGKAARRLGPDRYELYDICSASRQVTASLLDVSQGVLSDVRVVVDLTREPYFPDGMILAPDGESVIVALYDPRPLADGQAVQYSLATGEPLARWVCPGSPRVTCPQLIPTAAGVGLLLTTAVEGMSDEIRRRAPHAGCLFLGETEWSTLNDAPPWRPFPQAEALLGPA